MSRQFHDRLSDLQFSLKEMKNGLQEEQEDSELEHSDWENRDEADDEEPKVIDNSDYISRYERAIDLLDQAMKELNND